MVGPWPLTPLIEVQIFYPEFTSMKFCKNCNTNKEDSEFNKRKNKLQSSCRSCQKSKWNVYYSNIENRIIHNKKSVVRKNEHKDIINKIKDNPCTDCKQKFSPWIMDFDHINNDKKSDVCSLIKLKASLKTILIEISKCELVCANCHRDRTYKRLNKNNLSAPRNGYFIGIHNRP